MPYIGKEPVAGNFVLLDSITTSATATYALTKDSVAYSPESARNMIVSLNGVTQAPETAFTVSGSNITFSSALTSSDVIDYILVLGDVLSVGTPSDGTVGTSQMSYPLGNFSSTGIDDNATSTAITIDSSENVGIGTASPLSAGSTFGSLTANGSAGGEYYVATGGTAKGNLFNYSANANHIGLAAVDSSGELLFSTGGYNERMRIRSSGYVGIGTTSPEVLTHLKSADNTVFQLESTDATVYMKMVDSNTTGAGYIGYVTNDMTFWANNAERVRIDSSGNVGIGTNTPVTYTNTVSGSAKGLVIESAVPVLALKDTSASDDVSYIYQSTNDMRFLNYAGGEMTFRRGSGGTESMRIDSSGHLITPNGVTLGTSAGVYAAANTLDDYEEGTWTPTLSQGSATFTGARYIKIGKLVYAEVLVTAFTDRSTAAAIQLGGLPFNSSSDNRSGNVGLSRFINRSSGTIVNYMGTSRNYAHFYAIVANADYEQVYHSHLSSSNSNIYFSLIFEATS